MSNAGSWYHDGVAIPYASHAFNDVIVIDTAKPRQQYTGGAYYINKNNTAECVEDF